MCFVTMLLELHGFAEKRFDPNEPAKHLRGILVVSGG